MGLYWRLPQRTEYPEAYQTANPQVEAGLAPQERKKQGYIVRLDFGSVTFLPIIFLPFLPDSRAGVRDEQAQATDSVGTLPRPNVPRFEIPLDDRVKQRRA